MQNASRYAIAVICLALSLTKVMAQTFVIEGRVMDSQTGDPVPFANVFLKNTTNGATTDFQGYYAFTSAVLTDSLIASYIGYVRAALPVQNTDKQTLDFQLTSLAEPMEFALEVNAPSRKLKIEDVAIRRPPDDWTTIPTARGIRLQVKGDLSVAQQRQLDLIADLIKEVIDRR